jgi:hypothetical protein
MGSSSRRLLNQSTHSNVANGVERPPRPAPMDDLGFVETVDGLGQSIVVAVAYAAHRRFDAGFGQALGVFDRDVLGGFKWSSQHDEGGCDEEAQAAFGWMWAGAIVVTRSTVGGGTR